MSTVDTQIDCSALQCQWTPDRLLWVASKYGVEAFGARRSPDNWETCEPRSRQHVGVHRHAKDALVLDQRCLACRNIWGSVEMSGETGISVMLDRENSGEVADALVDHIFGG